MVGNTCVETGLADALSLISEIRDCVQNLEASAFAGSTAFHGAVYLSLRQSRFKVRKEVFVPDRYDGHAGYIDLLATKGGHRFAIELDNDVPRRKSISKLRQVQGIRIIILRAEHPHWERVRSLMAGDIHAVITRKRCAIFTPP